MLPERLQMLRSPVTFVLRESVLRIELIEFLHSPVAFGFREDRSCRNRN